MWRPQLFAPVLTRGAHPGAELPASSELVAFGHGGKQCGDRGLTQTAQVHHCCWARSCSLAMLARSWQDDAQVAGQAAAEVDGASAGLEYGPVTDGARSSLCQIGR